MTLFRDRRFLRGFFGALVLMASYIVFVAWG
jgi:hypothetical protein